MPTVHATTRPLTACLLALAVVLPALAAAPPGDERVRAAAVLDGASLALEDGRALRLAGLRPPRPPPGAASGSRGRWAEAAKAALGRLALGGAILLRHRAVGVDRHGRLQAHAFTASGEWIQGALLDAGLARVDSRDEPDVLVAEMLAREAEARRAGRGLWSAAYYRVRGASAAGNDIGSFQLVEGRVQAVAVVRGRAFLNFGPDWRSDFTVSLKPEARRRFEAAGIAPQDYHGRRVRVRGWLQFWNGPLVEATHPAQIELLEE